MNKIYIYILIYIIEVYCSITKIYAQQLYFIEDKIHHPVNNTNVVTYINNDKYSKNIDHLKKHYLKYNFLYGLNHKYHKDGIYENKYFHVSYLPMQIKINNNSLNIMNEIYQNKKNFFFSQIGIQYINKTNVCHIGLGARTIYKNKFITGYNFCCNSKYLNKNYQNLNIGAELLCDYFQLSMNKYSNTTKQQVDQLFKNKESTLNYGYNVKIQSRAQRFPYLLGKIELQQISHKKINNIFDYLNIEINKKFFTWVLGVTYNPIPSLFLNIDQIFAKNTHIAKKINISINYRTNIPFTQKIIKSHTNKTNINDILYNFIDYTNIQTLIHLNTKKHKKICDKKQLYIEQKNTKSQTKKINFCFPAKKHDNIKIIFNKTITNLDKNQLFTISDESLNNNNQNHIIIICDNIAQKNTCNSNFNNKNYNYFDNYNELHCNDPINQNSHNSINIEHKNNNQYDDKLVVIKQQEDTKYKDNNTNLIKSDESINPPIPIPPPLPMQLKLQCNTIDINQSTSTPPDKIKTLFNENVANINQKTVNSTIYINQIQQNIMHHKENKFANLGNIKHLEKLKKMEDNFQKTKFESNKINSIIMSQIINRKHSITYSDSENSSENNSISSCFSKSD